ncbi:hypothetical protein P7228_06970 [Altererythrobacter arenosus]|uniref:Uncharacterized protein n=1 Tax=Altererythrobacter arenosus TaxID=3032592 RepID=A0ABY8FVD3_9SPHN|nr:hypothetical protein [Altererythrobacter sp. CAU 1644]WFL78797.1 hypothetical protein P7228_06970 [Altererythrobacter sp. CAU 1644]
MPIIRNCPLPLILLCLLCATPAHAQQRETTAPDGSTRIDVLATTEELYGPEPPMEDCSDEQEAAILSGEIVVCRRKQDQRKFRTMPESDAKKRYARETMHAGDILPPDVAGEGIFRGPATVGGLCFIPPCPKDPALIIDIEALPEAPPGSDADRIARGLPPLGRDAANAPPRSQQSGVLGLPPSTVARPDAAANPAGSAEPEAEP